MRRIKVLVRRNLNQASSGSSRFVRMIGDLRISNSQFPSARQPAATLYSLGHC